MTKFKTRISPSGYRQFWGERAGRWAYVHRRVAEGHRGRALRPDEHVHHINENKEDNRARNLVPLKAKVHARIHREDPDACFRCGRSGHWDRECYARTLFDGDELIDYDAEPAE